jgi:hypothetical protein
MEYDTEEFYKLATEEFGEKFSIKPIQVSDETLEKYNAEHNFALTKKDFDNLEEVWLLENKCQNCGSDLGGFFGSFTWELIHGYGYCSECRCVNFKLYHYIGDPKVRIEAYALVGF